MKYLFHKHKKKIPFALLISLLFLVFAFGLFWLYKLSTAHQLYRSPAQLASEQQNIDEKHGFSAVATTSAQVSATVSASVSPQATPTPELSFEEQQKLYGPCVRLPVLMYHHVEDLTKAKTEGHAQLTVGTPYFEKQLQYLADHHYTAITAQQLLDFLDHGKPLPNKPIMLTFDDGYEDFVTDAFPLLQQYHMPSTWFIPTGLVENAGYVTWQQLDSINGSGMVLLSNHTWSHHTMKTKDTAVIVKEIDTAKLQLAAHHFDQPMIFAYPYGEVSAYAEKQIAQDGYSVAFTTVHGSIQCKQRRLELPRIRMGNGLPSQYGL